MSIANRVGSAAVGFLFGCGLFLFAFASAGAGHGSYLPFVIFGAPLSLIPFVGLFVAPFWWGALGWLLNGHPRPATWLMSIHTLSVGLVLWFGNPYEPGSEQAEDFRRVMRVMPLWLWGGLAAYALGLVTTWTLTLRLARSRGSN